MELAAQYHGPMHVTDAEGRRYVAVVVPQFAPWRVQGYWQALSGEHVRAQATLSLGDRVCAVADVHGMRHVPECACDEGSYSDSMAHLLAPCHAGTWEMEPRSPVLSRPASAAAAAAEDPAPPAHLFAYPLESNFSGARCVLYGGEATARSCCRV